MYSPEQETTVKSQQCPTMGDLHSGLLLLGGGLCHLSAVFSRHLLGQGSGPGAGHLALHLTDTLLHTILLRPKVGRVGLLHFGEGLDAQEFSIYTQKKMDTYQYRIKTSN